MPHAPHRPIPGWLLAVVLALGLLAPLLGSQAAHAQAGEAIRAYDVRIVIEPDGDLLITETIAYDFGPNERHGIVRDVPTRLRYDDVFDRVYPLDVVSVRATDAPDDVEVTEEGASTHIRIGDPDRTVTGRHAYELIYRVEGALNGFQDHDELYWNAVGTGWNVPIGRATVQVSAPARIDRVACFQGYAGSTEPCASAVARGTEAAFEPGRALSSFEGVTVVVALPKGAVPAPEPMLRERWAVDRAFSVTPATLTLSLALLAGLAGWLGTLVWRRGRDRRYPGSAVDQIHGSATPGDVPVPIGEGDAEAPVEFEPPEGIRPGQVGTLFDERANVLDVTATIVDLATRGHLMIVEIPKEDWFGKADWRLVRQPAPGDELVLYERRLLDAIFQGGVDQVLVSELKTKFAERLHKVQDELYRDVVRRGWFAEHPETVRKRWAAAGLVATAAGAGLTFVLARWTHWGLVGIPAVLAGLALLVMSSRMPARTAAGTAMVRRVRGFRVVIDKAETHLSRWAEQELVFTRFLPYAVVFGLTEKWARAFEGLAIAPDTSSWYVGTRPFSYATFGDSIDGFAVTTGGTLASTPSGSGSSGFGGGGSSGGGGGGGGGGSW